MSPSIYKNMKNFLDTPDSTLPWTQKQYKPEIVSIG